MTEVARLNGFILYDGFLSGYENLAKEKKRINEINVFPVPDGDTGTNMVSTFHSTLQVPRVTRSLSDTLGHIADRALSGARGNSGIILAQFLNGLARECVGRETMSTGEFALALKNAAALTYGAVENPREGTLLTLLRVWSEEMHRLGAKIHDFGELMLEAAHTARRALEDTKEQLEELRTARVVDAGASGFVAFIEGICRMILTGERPEGRKRMILSAPPAEEAGHEVPDDGVPLSFRYCTEALLGARVPAQELREALTGSGDSLVISEGRDKTRIHVHTDDPAGIFLRLRDFGSIIEQKVDDMHLQREAVHRRVSPVAIVTDSIADLPRELADRYQVHVIPQKILWGKDEYLDRVTITPETFYPYLDAREDYPGSSVPDPRRVEQVFSWLSTHYDSIVAIPVGKALSGTWKVMDNAAKGLRDGGYPVSVIDSRLNSAAQGLAVLAAAEDAARGLGRDEILERLERRIAGAKIFVSVATFKYMVRGGRVSALKGFIAALANLKPIISLDGAGKGIAFGASFSSAGSRKKMLGIVAKNAPRIGRYAVVHASSPDLAHKMAADIEGVLGKKAEFVSEISPAVGIHAGIGAVAVAWLPD